jgi:hypothetical protein
MNKSLATLAAIAAASFSLGALAQADATVHAAPPLTHAQARDAKNQADAHYDAAKKEADARLDLDKANCESSLNGAQERACKDDAKAAANKEKADAKVQKEDTKASIKATTK